MALCTLIAGCGGGGGGGGDDAPSSFPIEAAVSNVYASPRNFTISHKYEGTSSTATFKFTATPGTDVTFEGVAAKSANLTLAADINGTPYANASGKEYYTTSPYRYLGSEDSDGEYEVATNQVALPATARIGDSGDFYTSVDYTNNTKAVIEETNVVNWSLERDPASRANAYFCSNTIYPFVSNDDATTVSTCYKINGAGDVLGFKVVYKYPDGVVNTFQ